MYQQVYNSLHYLLTVCTDIDTHKDCSVTERVRSYGPSRIRLKSPSLPDSGMNRKCIFHVTSLTSLLVFFSLCTR
jgi:hypothetical protein